eukprot:jgi/Chlat1/2931/Chrsp2S04673
MHPSLQILPGCSGYGAGAEVSWRRLELEISLAQRCHLRKPHGGRVKAKGHCMLSTETPPIKLVFLLLRTKMVTVSGLPPGVVVATVSKNITSKL